jgi:ABC-type transport system substrate-binding protein
MKKIVLFAAVFVLILLLTKIANQVPPPAPSGTAFSLKAQQVVQCSPDEITLVDPHQKATHLEKDATWPDCSVFQKDDVLDFYLSRGEKTRFLSYEKTAWWRKTI